MTTAENIRKYRKKKGLTQKEFAELLGKSYSSVQKYEIGIVKPSLTLLKKIADILDVPIWFLTAIDESENGLLKSQNEYTAFLMEESMININEDSAQSKILLLLRKLNQEGKQVAVQRVMELTEISRYTLPDDNSGDTE